MPNLHRIAFTTLIASLFFTSPGLFAEEPAKAEEPPAPVIVGNPPADHPFGKLKIGMTYDEALAIVGKPTNETSWCTGKQNIPFYFGDDRGRAEVFIKGMGKLDFNAKVSMYPFRICKGSTPLDLVYVEYDPEASGELPK